MRFVTDRAGSLFADAARKYLADKLSPAAYRDPLSDDDYLISIPASKTLLIEFFMAASMNIKKAEFYLVAEQMRVDDIHPEIKAILNGIAKTLDITRSRE